MKKLIAVLFVLALSACSAAPVVPNTKQNYTGRDFLATTYPHCADRSGSGYAVAPCDQGLGGANSDK